MGIVPKYYVELYNADLQCCFTDQLKSTTNGTKGTIDFDLSRFRFPGNSIIVI